MVKKGLVLLAGCSFCFSLVGCGVTEPSTAVSQANAESATAQRIACEQRKSEETKTELNSIPKLDPEAQKNWALMSQVKGLVAAATGHRVDDCDTGPSYNEVLITEVKEKNASVRAVLPAAIAGTAAAYVSGKALDVAAQGVQNAGNRTSTTTNGDGNSSAYTHEQTTSNTTSSASSSGDSSPPSTGGSTSVGPNKPVDNSVTYPTPEVE